MPDPQIYLGLMSGTSVDGIDAVAVEFADDQQLRVLGHFQQPFEPEQQQQLQQLISQHRNASLDDYARLDQLWAEWAAQAVTQLLDVCELEPEQIAAIGSHGQTIAHFPNAKPAYTLQLGDPNRLAALTNIAVVADFRRKDVALGGQGAPLVPAFHSEILRHPQKHRLILNLGGIANVTWLPAGSNEILGFDTGPANTLLDQWFLRHNPNAPQKYDKDGAFARRGRVNEALLSALLKHPFFSLKPPKSTGREDFHLGWLAQYANGLEATDVQRTLVELTCTSITGAIHTHLPNAVAEVIVAGGGRFNTFLLECLARQLKPINLVPIEQFGFAAEQLEAIAFAWLAKQRLAKANGSIAAVTGAQRAAILGGVYLP